MYTYSAGPVVVVLVNIKCRISVRRRRDLFWNTSFELIVVENISFTVRIRPTIILIVYFELQSITIYSIHERKISPF